MAFLSSFFAAIGCVLLARARLIRALAAYAYEAPHGGI